MDWSWMDKPKYSKEYLDGVDLFIDFACGYSDPSSSIKCPCVNCACVELDGTLKVDVFIVPKSEQLP
ncbi:hypothetical protein Taro_046184 [Colocasia esculenta]|uniref:Transposase-associated domain-containing protein n=1 Tax=Colocasia esculenta TaxID=4460 RepID=A0A843X1R1_COLES|nr:hypothetical protein [Colocasia esculenta]